MSILTNMSIKIVVTAVKVCRFGCQIDNNIKFMFQIIPILNRRINNNNKRVKKI